MSAVFFWSDLHLGHEFVARTRGFDDVAEHDAAIARGWREVVRPRDTVYVLGDISSGSAVGTRAALSLIEDLPGSKRLVSGNHDGIHPMNRPRPWEVAMWNEVFEEITPFAQRKVVGTKFLLSHFPYIGGGDHVAGEERHAQWRLPDLGAPLVHGHVHGEWAVKGRMFNVGVEHRRTPVNQEQIIAWIEGLS